ncbi:MAG: hypothetical protein KDD42_04095 [Bdellovibrionales bacterium]|nr:hypothetical protein [Bdellovibrionales bacterium]
MQSRREDANADSAVIIEKIWSIIDNAIKLSFLGTAKLRKELGIKDKELSDLDPNMGPLSAWYVDLIRIGPLDFRNISKNQALSTVTFSIILPITTVTFYVTRC